MSGCKLMAVRLLLCSLHFVHRIIAMLLYTYLQYIIFICNAHITFAKNLELECLNCSKKICWKVSHHLQYLLPFVIEYCNSRPCNNANGKFLQTVLLQVSAYFLMFYIYVAYSCTRKVCVDKPAATMCIFF